MNKITEFINNLQNKPYEVRTRILWTATAVAAIIVLAVWFIGFKSEFNNLNKQSILGSEITTSQLSAQHYTGVDGAESANNQLLIYFYIKNDTNDILNISKLTDIKLNSGGKDYTPVKITDRQNQPFAQKILSRSQTFGILTFDAANIKSGSLTFDSLSFENSPQSIFKEQINLDLRKLSKPQALRD